MKINTDDDTSAVQGALPSDTATTELKTNNVGLAGISNKDTLSTARPLTDTQGIIGGAINSPITSNDTLEEAQLEASTKIEQTQDATHQTPFENFKSKPASPAGATVKKTLFEQNTKDVIDSKDTRPVDIGESVTFGKGTEAPQGVSDLFTQDQQDLAKKPNQIF